MEKIILPNHPWTDKISEYKIMNDSLYSIPFEKIDEFIDKCKKNNCKFIIPLMIHNYEFIYDNKNVIDNNNFKYIIPDRTTFNMFNNRLSFHEFMMKHGFGEYIPKKYDVIQYPCIIKKYISEYGYNSHIINSSNDIDEYIGKDADIKKYIINEIISGNIEYATHILAVNGKIAMMTTVEHHHDEHIYIQGYQRHPQKSMYFEITNDIKRIFEKIIEVTNYSGFMCIDYKITDSGPKIFEINPRIGGSLVWRDGAILEKFILCYVNILSRP